MRVISRKALRDFASRHPESQSSLNKWASVVESSHWGNPSEVRRTFNATDFVGDRVVFDVAGNRYRIVAYVHYRRSAVYIKHVLTHQEYSKGAWKR